MIAMATVCATFAGALIAAFVTGRDRGFFTGISTVLLATILVMWTRSHFRTDHLDFIIAPESKSLKRAYFISDSGGIVAGFDRMNGLGPNSTTLLLGSDKATGQYPVLASYVPKTTKSLGRSGFAVLYKPDLDLGKFKWVMFDNCQMSRSAVAKPIEKLTQVTFKEVTLDDDK